MKIVDDKLKKDLVSSGWTPLRIIIQGGKNIEDLLKSPKFTFGEAKKSFALRLDFSSYNVHNLNERNRH
jgi:hypothetical protein